MYSCQKLLCLWTFCQYTYFLSLEIQMCILFPPSKTKSITLTQRLNEFIMRKCGVQRTRVICCNRFSIPYIYDVSFFNDMINLL